MNYSKVNNEILLEIRKDVTSLRERQLVHEDVLIGHNHRFDYIEVRLDKLEQRIDKLEQRMDKIEEKLDRVIELLIVEREERMAMMSILISHDKRLLALEKAIL